MALLGCTGTRVISANIWLEAIQLLAGDRGLVRIAVGAHPHGHDDFFQRCIAGALADAVDGALHLARTGLHSRERVRDRQAEVVVAVRGNSNFVDAGNFFTQGANEAAVFLRHGVTDGIGNIDGGGAGCDHRFDYLAEKRDVGAGGILGREFNVRAQRLGVADGLARLLQALLA